MKKSKPKSSEKDDSPEQVDAEDVLARMRAFVERKEEFVNAVKADKDRRISSGKKS